MDLADTLTIAASGMKAQSERLKMVAENVANAQVTGRTPEEDPYRRKMILFKNVFDREMGVHKVVVDSKKEDMSAFPLSYQPGHPAANAEGYVRTSNVTSMIEMMDMREARRAYEANLRMVETSRTMMQRTLDLLR